MSSRKLLLHPHNRPSLRIYIFCPSSHYTYSRHFTSFHHSELNEIEFNQNRPSQKRGTKSCFFTSCFTHLKPLKWPLRSIKLLKHHETIPQFLRLRHRWKWSTPGPGLSLQLQCLRAAASTSHLLAAMFEKNGKMIFQSHGTTREIGGC
jgi:hypothetical protein